MVLELSAYTQLQNGVGLLGCADRQAGMPVLPDAMIQAVEGSPPRGDAAMLRAVDLVHASQDQVNLVLWKRGTAADQRYDAVS